MVRVRLRGSQVLVSKAFMAIPTYFRGRHSVTNPGVHVPQHEGLTGGLTGGTNPGEHAPQHEGHIGGTNRGEHVPQHEGLTLSML
jgi:hypothetical protein